MILFRILFPSIKVQLISKSPINVLSCFHNLKKKKEEKSINESTNDCIRNNCKRAVYHRPN